MLKSKDREATPKQFKTKSVATHIENALVGKHSAFLASLFLLIEIVGVNIVFSMQQLVTAVIGCIRQLIDVQLFFFFAAIACFCQSIAAAIPPF